MRLSDIKGDRVLEVIADIIDPIANIVGDKEAMAALKKEKMPEGADRHEYLLGRVKKALPKLIKGHKTDIISILSAIEGVSVEEYTESLNLIKLMRDCTDLLNDEAFVAVFTLARSETSSGSAQGSTEEPKQ